SAAAIIPVYVWSPEEEGDWPPGSASRWWLHHSLAALDQELRARRSRLILARGPALPALRKLVSATGADAVYWNRRYEPAAAQCSREVAEGLSRMGIQARHCNGSLLADPAEFLNRSGAPYQVYTAFQRRLLRDLTPAPLLPTPRVLRRPSRWPE